MRSLVFNTLFWSLSALFALVCYAAAWLPWRGPLMAIIIAYGATTRFCMHWIAGIPLEVRGHAPRGEPVIIAAKHQAYADGPLMVALAGDLNFVIGNGIEKFPLVNRIVKRAGATMVDAQGRSRAQGALKQSIDRIAEDHRPVLIYPEGGMAAVGVTRRYRKGVHMLYAELGRSVVPVATNLGLRWPEEEWEKHPGPAVIEFLEPIPPGLPREIFMQRLQDAIETRTRELEAEGQS
ncbi:lysophospholipid acyltransferase family protein [uncultured Maricaulis sp.]|uniref:lysophospholipid acyltransferase family protein n=1 Tax=uncultured Maricaulis sp. TaxID=174710 RepID=UPI0030D995FB